MTHVHLLLLLLRRFDDARVRFPGLAKVVEESETVEQEGQVDGDEREMCGALRNLFTCEFPGIFSSEKNYLGIKPKL